MIESSREHVWLSENEGKELKECKTEERRKIKSEQDPNSATLDHSVTSYNLQRSDSEPILLTLPIFLKQ